MGQELVRQGTYPRCEQNVLAKGLNFAIIVCVWHLPIIDLIVASAIKKINLTKTEAEQVRLKFGCVHTASQNLIFSQSRLEPDGSYEV